MESKEKYLTKEEQFRISRAVSLAALVSLLSLAFNIMFFFVGIMDYNSSRSGISNQNKQEVRKETKSGDKYPTNKTKYIIKEGTVVVETTETPN